ncbi:Uncharacterised protein [Chromobacterium violaceum]|uniref:Uncharacterized protein n=1 Tax=Chromobacterium violaceum TaxID=536 RepID=A0A447TIP3_CHRVL|nr:Uncharacterised protein [Chromobacterium violaceum]
MPPQFSRHDMPRRLVTDRLQDGAAQRQPAALSLPAMQRCPSSRKRSMKSRNTDASAFSERKSWLFAGAIASEHPRPDGSMLRHPSPTTQSRIILSRQFKMRTIPEVLPIATPHDWNFQFRSSLLHGKPHLFKCRPTFPRNSAIHPWSQVNRMTRQMTAIHRAACSLPNQLFLANDAAHALDDNEVQTGDCLCPSRHHDQIRMHADQKLLAALAKT